MAEKDIKKSLSLKSHKISGAKQSKTPAGSKNVTIQVRRKKINKPDNYIKELSLIHISEPTRPY